MTFSVLLQAGVKLSSHGSTLDLDPALWPAGAPSCCWWLPGWGTLALAHPQDAAVAQGFGQCLVLSQQPDWALRELCGANTVTVPPQPDPTVEFCPAEPHLCSLPHL